MLLSRRLMSAYNTRQKALFERATRYMPDGTEKAVHGDHRAQWVADQRPAGMQMRQHWDEEHATAMVESLMDYSNSLPGTSTMERKRQEMAGTHQEGETLWI